MEGWGYDWPEFLPDCLGRCFCGVYCGFGTVVSNFVLTNGGNSPRSSPWSGGRCVAAVHGRNVMFPWDGGSVEWLGWASLGVVWKW